MNDPIKKPKPIIPSDFSNHDERSEAPAVEKHWDEESSDASAMAGERLAKFKQDGVPLSDEDWEKEEELDDKIPDHIDAAVDRTVSLEELAEEELEEGEEE